MRSSIKTILLTVLTLSALTIAFIEISGISRNALFNKLRSGDSAAYEEAKASVDAKRHEDSLKLEASRAMPKTRIFFDDTLVNFGKIKEGDSVMHSYAFTNTGNNPVIIADVKVSCGCTAPSWSKDPVAPGQKGKIDVVFHSKNKPGMQKKTVIVVANTDPEMTNIRFEADVIPE